MQRVLGIAAAAALVAAGVIHLAFAPTHFDEYVPFGVFFVVVGLAQLAAAPFLLRTSSRATWLAIAAANAGVCLLWAVTRFIGLPIGPDAGAREAIAFADVLATVLQLAVVATLGVMLSTRASVRHFVRVPVRRGLAGMALSAIVLGLLPATVAAASTAESHHDEAHHAELPAHHAASPHSHSH
jgi:hypothetical protein